MLLWYQQLCFLKEISLRTWTSLIAIHLLRFYRVFFTSFFLIYALLIIFSIYHFELLHSYFLSYSWLAVVIYLMRPTVVLKKAEYVYDFFSLELYLCSIFIGALFFTLASLVQAWVIGVITVWVMASYSFLYDYHACLPDKCAGSVMKGTIFVWYQLPIFLCLFFLTSVSEYFCNNFVAYSIKLFCIYPFISALVTVFYVASIHQNYELYYAE